MRCSTHHLESTDPRAGQQWNAFDAVAKDEGGICMRDQAAVRDMCPQQRGRRERQGAHEAGRLGRDVDLKQSGLCWAEGKIAAEKCRVDDDQSAVVRSSPKRRPGQRHRGDQGGREDLPRGPEVVCSYNSCGQRGETHWHLSFSRFSLYVGGSMAAVNKQRANHLATRIDALSFAGPGFLGPPFRLRYPALRLAQESTG